MGEATGQQAEGSVGQAVYLPGRSPGIFYGWWLVAISGFVLSMALVPLFHAMAVWAVVLERQFGWSRTQIGFALTFSRVEGGLMGPVEGYLTDRVGTRRMVMTGLIIMGAGLLFFGQVRNLWMFYAAYVVMSLGSGLGGWLPLMTLLNHWFARRRAMAIGWASLVNGAGALLLVPAIAWAIDPDHDRLGWQVTASAIGVFLLVAAFPISRLIRNRPQEYNLRPDGDPPNTPPPAATGGRPTRRGDRVGSAGADMTVSQALRTPAFWLISFGHGFTAMVLLAIMAHLGLLMVEDKGFDVQTTGWIVTVYVAFSMVFQLVGGYIGDRVPKRIALSAFTAIQASGVVILATASSISTFYIFAVLFGAGMGGRHPLTVAIRGEYFGRASFGKILGISTVPMNLLLLAAAPLAGYIRDYQGSYTLAFWILAGLNFLGAALFLMAKRPGPRSAVLRAAAAKPTHQAANSPK